ncbi:MAG: acyloxyacyl hydrolase [Sphingomicrobium sp.]
MKNFVSLAAAAATVASSAAPAHAGELFGGIYKHAVETPLSLEGGLEKGFDFQLGYRGDRLFPGLGLQPYAFGALNSAGDTSYAAAGLSWKFGDKVFIRPGLGIAIHNGSADKVDRSDRIALGSRVLFEPELGVGVRIAPNATIEASWVHLSHAQLFGKQNPGLDNIGARLSLGL